MKILLLTRAYGNAVGGMERLSYELHQTLQQHAQVTLLAYTGSRLSSPFFVLLCLPRALAFARSVDVVHIGDPLLSFAGWLIKKLTNRPVVCSVHGLDISYPSLLYQWYLRLFFHHFDAYIAISRHVAELTRGRGIAKPITIIPPGINDDYYNPAHTREELSQLLNRDTSNMTLLLTAGRLIKRKGHEWFITHVLSQLPAQFGYVIAGDGPEGKAITAAVEKHGLRDRVWLLGRATPETLSQLYNTADAFIQPNIQVPNDVEGFGIVLLEAASCNQKVLAADIDGIPDAIHPPHNGLLLPSGDADAWKNAVMELPRRSKETHSRGYTLEHFSWNKIIERYLQTYQDCVID